MRRTSFALVSLLCILATPARAERTSRAGATIVVSVASNTYSPLENVQVHVRAARLSARTDWMGEVKLGPLPRGIHRVEVRLLGYMPASADIELDGDTAGVFFLLEPIRVVLDTQRTVARMVSPNMVGYERRKAMGIGRFLDDTLLDRQQLKDLPIALSMLLPGLRAVEDRGRPGKYVLLSNRSTGRVDTGPCFVEVYVEGKRYDGDLDDFGPSDLAGIEFYSMGSAPVEYRRPSPSKRPACQVLLLWLRY
jgi:hypothetical protein